MRLRSLVVVDHDYKAVPTCGAFSFAPVCGARVNLARRVLTQRYDRPWPKKRECKRCLKIRKKT